jgi:hypothetical protein
MIERRQKLNTDLLPNLVAICQHLEPGGSIVGHKYYPSQAFSIHVDLSSGAWVDYGNRESKGDDIPSLWAMLKNVPLEIAIDELEKAWIQDKKIWDCTHIHDEDDLQNITGTPPPGISPRMVHPTLGYPTTFWVYRDSDGNPLTWVAEYDNKGVLEQRAWSYLILKDKWTCRYMSPPRVIYDVFNLKDKKQIIVCDSERAADAAKKIVGVRDDVAVTTWQLDAARKQKRRNMAGCRKRKYESRFRSGKATFSKREQGKDSSAG